MTTWDRTYLLPTLDQERIRINKPPHALPWLRILLAYFCLGNLVDLGSKKVNAALCLKTIVLHSNQLFMDKNKGNKMDSAQDTVKSKQYQLTDDSDLFS